MVLKVVQGLTNLILGFGGFLQHEGFQKVLFTGLCLPFFV